jgi:hypothetical protein
MKRIYFPVTVYIMTGVDSPEGFGVGYLYGSKKLEYCFIVKA